MLASINWLKQYVDIPVTPEVLADKLTGWAWKWNR